MRPSRWLRWHASDARWWHGWWLLALVSVGAQQNCNPSFDLSVEIAQDVLVGAQIEMEFCIDNDSTKSDGTPAQLTVQAGATFQLTTVQRFDIPAPDPHIGLTGIMSYTSFTQGTGSGSFELVPRPTTVNCESQPLDNTHPCGEITVSQDIVLEEGSGNAMTACIGHADLTVLSDAVGGFEDLGYFVRGRARTTASAMRSS
jgi:hypothetical protein